MEEKKLTDEEIVKALECCANGGSQKDCELCPIGIIKCSEQENLMPQLALDLIHRLQSENKELRTESDRMVAEHLAFTELAKKADEQQKKYIDYLKRKLDEANVTYRSRL